MAYLKKCAAIILCVALAGCAQNMEIGKRHLSSANTTDSEERFGQHSSEATSSFFGKHKSKRVAVSGFDDLSGARVENGTSTAVAASGRILTHYILMENNNKNHYTLLDRSVLNELLNERRLAGQVNATNEAEVINAAPEFMREGLAGNVPPIVATEDLLPSDYLIYGAVVGYDKRLKDDGTGAGIAGYNVSNRHSRDQVSVVLELIDVQTGAIVGIGFGSQLIESTSVRASIFAQLRVNRILEFEQAAILNDPTTLALIRAIDMALGEMFQDATS